MILAQLLEQILGVQHANDLIKSDIRLIDRNTRKTALQGQIDGLRHRCIAGKSNHINTWHHYLTRRRISKLEDAMNHLRLLLLQHPLLLTDRNQQAQFFLSNKRSLAFDLTSQKSHKARSNSAKKP